MIRLELDQLQAGALAPLDLALASGECLCLGGPSGSGKSRLLRAIADLDAHGGQARLDGVACAAMPATRWRRQVGLLAAESAWWGETVGEHFPAAVPADCLAQLGFAPPVMDWELARCSTGEKQRLALLRLLCNHPRVLLLDEPTASLDPANVRRVEQVVLDYLKDEGAAAIWVSHDPAQVARVASRAAVIEGEHVCEVQP